MSLSLELRQHNCVVAKPGSPNALGPLQQHRLVCQECAMDLRISGKPRQIASGQVSEGAISRHTTRVSQFELPGIVLSALAFD
jgi:hypothetical protein